jgi:hypothetical protein
MLKPFVAIATAATIAGLSTVLSGPADVAASPLPQATADVTPACRQQPWPYLNCTGTDFDNRNFRLIAIDRHTR